MISLIIIILLSFQTPKSTTRKIRRRRFSIVIKVSRIFSISRRGIEKCALRIIFNIFPGQQ